MDPERARQLNREMWNATGELHARSQLPRLLDAFRDPGFSTLDAVERRLLADIGVAAGRVAQLSCNNGRELLSVARLGARQAVGFDISEVFVQQAERLAEVALASWPNDPPPEVVFHRCDVYDLPEAFDGRYREAFDLVYVTVGAIGWLHDLDAWYRIVTELLAPGGRLLVYEMHPILDMFDAEHGPELRHSYFRTEPYVETVAPDYYEPDEVVDAASYWYHHTLGDVVGGCARAGLELHAFEEFDHDLSNVFRAFQELAARPPLSYALVARKP